MDIKSVEQIIDQTPVRTRDVIWYPDGMMEKIMGDWKVGHARCPNCDKLITLYKKDVDGSKTRSNKNCPYCGFNRRLIIGDNRFS